MGIEFLFANQHIGFYRIQVILQDDRHRRIVFDGVRVSKAITISADGNYCVANVYVDSCFPEDFIKLNPPMSIILQYDLYSIETNMLVSKEEFDTHWKKCKDLCES